MNMVLWPSFVWLDPRFRAQKGAPVNDHGVDMMMKNTWKQADTTWDPACTIRIAVLPGDDIMQRQGKWRVISPDEVRDSFLHQMAERLGQDADEDEQAKWKNCA